MTISVAQAQLFFLAFARLMAMLIHIPVLGGNLIPNPVKIALGALLTIVILPWQPLPADAVGMPTVEALSAVGVGLAAGREILIGTLAGFAAALTFGALQIAAEMIGTSSGFSAGRTLNPALDLTGSALDQFFVMIATLIFISVNGHHGFILGVQRTFTVLPLNSGLPDLTYERLIRLTAELILAGLQLSLPVVGTLLLTDVTLGLLARVAPQVQVFFLGVPLKVALGLITLALSFAALLPTLARLFAAIGPRAVYLLGG